MNGDENRPWPKLSPAYWAQEERDHFTELNQTFGRPKPLAQGRKGMVVGTSGAFALRVGVEVLRQGGNAIDAALSTALTQIALRAGSVTSYAGILQLICYEAQTGKIHALSAGFDVPQDETDPLSIPSPPTPSGRTAVVPGFMAGVEAAHQRFGKLPFGSLFEPAIFLADEGLEVDDVLAGRIQFRREVLSRRPETRAVFTKANGEFYQQGDHFRQPALAQTLRAVAGNGAQYMYTGNWARAFVRAVQEDGGKITLQDLEKYSPTWMDPLQTTYRGYEVYAPPGAVAALEGLNLLELADLQQYGHYTQSPEALYRLIQISRTHYIMSFNSEEELRSHLPSLSLSPSSRASKAQAQMVWEALRTPASSQWLQELLTPDDSHTDAVVTVDASGNVAALGHTIGTDRWGSTGIFVGGVSISDTACYQQWRLEQVGPGGRLPNELNPLIALQGGKPALACGAIGHGLHEATLQRLHNVLDFGMDPKAATETPIFHSPMWGPGPDGKPQYHMQAIPGDDFSEELIQGVQERGQPIRVLTEHERSEYRGYWIGLLIDPETGGRQAGTCWEFNGYALSE